MLDRPYRSELQMEHINIPGTNINVSRVALGTWAIGGWMWGGTDETESIATIRTAIKRGINLIDTAPAYGFGHSEELVGQALAEGNLRTRVVIATKVGLEWSQGRVFRNASRARILKEVADLCDGFGPIISTSTRCTGRIPLWRSKRLPRRWTVCCGRARSAQSASAIFR